MRITHFSELRTDLCDLHSDDNNSVNTFASTLVLEAQYILTNFDKTSRSGLTRTHLLHSNEIHALTLAEEM